MNAITMVGPTAIDPEEEAVPQHNGPRVRVAIREIREYAYRALVVAGASPGEAATAAGQVLHAELHTGEGLTGLLSDLTRGAWPRSGLTCSRRSGMRPVLEVGCGERSGELRVGPHLIDLVAGEAEPAVATTPAEVPVTSLLDAALLAAASATGTTVAAMRPTPRGPYAVRLATGEGDLAHGLIDPAGMSSLAGVDGVSGPGGLIVLTGVPAVEPTLTHLTWSSPAERAERRRGAARHGVEVDETTWRVAAAHAQRFLVPEDDS